MTFLTELEKIISILYLKMLNKKHYKNVYKKSINCASFEVIVMVIKSILIDCSNKGWNVLETANAIIYKLLQKNFFVYENPQMALQIGYVYLRRQGVAISHFSVDAITNDSTFDDVKALIVTW